MRLGHIFYELINCTEHGKERRGFTDTPADMVDSADISYEANWVNDTLGVAGTDPAITGKLDSGLYLLLYGTEGAAVGNGLSANPGLTATPLLVHVDPSRLSDVLDNLGPSGTGIISSTLINNVNSGGTGVVAITVIANPAESGSGDYSVWLMAQEQLDLLATVAGEKAGSAIVVNANIATYSPAQEYNVTLSSGRNLTVVTGEYSK